jgi:ppGpp synthetase/RelA/SpoT-type nucleotidyltranferase
MAYSKGEVNRAGAVIAEGKRPTTPAEVDRLGHAIDVVDWWRSEHAAPLNAVAANLRHYAAEVGEPVVAQRLKRLPTIAQKLVRLPTMKLASMADIGGVRAVVPDQEAAYDVANRLRRNWTITRFRDYVTEPKADGYRALHLINRHRGRLIEVQIRTPLQDNWADLVEVYSEFAEAGLKYGEGPAVVRQALVELSLLDTEFEADEDARASAHAKSEELLSSIDNFFDEQADEP